ncbi:MAG: PEP-CTERM sorting domain-containing protein [Bryobacteraceae bacterium]
MLRRFLLSTAILLCASTAQAITIVSVTGPNQFGNIGQAYLGNQYPSVGFSTASDYVNVSISVSLIGGSIDSAVTLGAFLTTQVGPGTTAANEIASSTQQVSVAASPAFPLQITEVTVLTGLTLPAGAYYLTLEGSGTPEIPSWANSLDVNLTATFDAGAAIAFGYLFGPTLFPPSYHPAAVVSQSNGRTLWFNVTGDPANVPEPASLTMLAGGLALACLYSRRK